MEEFSTFAPTEEQTRGRRRVVIESGEVHVLVYDHRGSWVRVIPDEADGRALREILMRGIWRYQGQGWSPGEMR